MTRGVEILRLKGGANKASKMRNVTAAKLVGSLARTANADGSISYVCP